MPKSGRLPLRRLWRFGLAKRFQRNGDGPGHGRLPILVARFSPQDRRKPVEVHVLFGRLPGFVEKHRPALLAGDAIMDCQHFARLVRTALDLTALAAEDGHMRLAEQERRLLMDFHVAGVKNALQHHRRAKRVQHPRKRVDRRAQPEDGPQSEQPRKCGVDRPQRHVRKVPALQV